MSKKTLSILAGLFSVASIALVQPVLAQSDSAASDANKSNNPLNLAYVLNMQDYYTPKLFDSNGHTNDAFLRFAAPIAPIGFVGVPQIIRATMPISTRPRPGEDYTTGAGDLNVFDIFLVKETGTQIGVGPLLTIPTASNDYLGTGKWQAGLAGVVIDSTPRRMIGGLLQWQQSFAGDSDRPGVSSTTFQPFVLYNLPYGWYLRSTAIWNFNLKNGDYAIPAGAGIGKATRMGKTIVNFYIEPQWAVAHSGVGQPQFTLLGGMNLTFE